MGVIEQANTYVLTKLADSLASDYTPLFHTPAFLANRAALVEALAAGDLEATKSACRAWCKLVIGFTVEAQHAAVA
jgi:hypothetical protein